MGQPVDPASSPAAFACFSLHGAGGRDGVGAQTEAPCFLALVLGRSEAAAPSPGAKGTACRVGAGWCQGGVGRDMSHADSREGTQPASPATASALKHRGREVVQTEGSIWSLGPPGQGHFLRSPPYKAGDEVWLFPNLSHLSSVGNKPVPRLMDFQWDTLSSRQRLHVWCSQPP